MRNWLFIILASIVLIIPSGCAKNEKDITLALSDDEINQYAKENAMESLYYESENNLAILIYKKNDVYGVMKLERALSTKKIISDDGSIVHISDKVIVGQVNYNEKCYIAIYIDDVELSETTETVLIEFKYNEDASKPTKLQQTLSRMKGMIVTYECDGVSRPISHISFKDKNKNELYKIK